MDEGAYEGRGRKARHQRGEEAQAFGLLTPRSPSHPPQPLRVPIIMQLQTLSASRLPDLRSEAPGQHWAGVRTTRGRGCWGSAGGRPSAAAPPRTAEPRASRSLTQPPRAGGCRASSSVRGGGRAGSRCSPAPLQPISGHPAARSDPTKIAANACDLRAAPHLKLTPLARSPLARGACSPLPEGAGRKRPGGGVVGEKRKKEGRKEEGKKQAASR